MKLKLRVTHKATDLKAGFCACVTEVGFELSRQIYVFTVYNTNLLGPNNLMPSTWVLSCAKIHNFCSVTFRKDIVLKTY